MGDGQRAKRRGLSVHVANLSSALEELPWKDITDQDPVRLIVPLATIEEIDKRKNGDDRKADRALGSRGSDDERRLGGHHDS